MEHRPKAPGEVLEKKFMQPHEITQKELANHAGWTRKHVNEICKGKARITVDTALILGKAFNTEPGYWLELQQNFDVWGALHCSIKMARIATIKPLVMCEHPTRREA